MTEDKRDRNTPEGAGMPEEEFSRLMGSISAMAPLLKGVFSPVNSASSDNRAKSGNHNCREALLLALKPYLSPKRCEAVDYFIRLARVGDAIRSLQ